MRRTLNLGIGAGAVAAAVTMVAGVASATTAAPHQAAGPAAAVVSVNKHITRAQAARIAKAKVPHSRVIEIESDDLHDRAVWKVTLATSHGRVVVDVDKRTGKATIVGHGGSGGHGDAIVATSLSTSGGTAAWTGRDAREGDRRDRDHGDRRDRGHGDRHDHDRGDNDHGEDGR